MAQCWTISHNAGLLNIAYNLIGMEWCCRESSMRMDDMENTILICEYTVYMERIGLGT